MLVLAHFPLGAIWAFARRRDLATAVRRRCIVSLLFGGVVSWQFVQSGGRFQRLAVLVVPTRW